MILLIMALLLAAMLAAWTLSRVTGTGGERDDTLKRLAAAAAALDQFAAANGRLPCPANPVLNTGASDPVGASKSCPQSAIGTLPWATLGLNSDAGLDGWGRKISYRVYTNAGGGSPNFGSLTQDRGVNMTECDITDADGKTDDNGLCVSGTPHNRSTMPGAFADSPSNKSFFARKGLTIHDYSDTWPDAAYVLISHGQSGRGAWTVAGTQVLPLDGSNHERDNTTETGAFWIEALSDPDQGISSGSHFDDLLVYARLPDLVKRIGLVERQWPDVDPASIGPTALALTQANVETATGTTVNPTTGDTGSASVNFGPARVSGFTGETATNVSYDPNASGGATGGIGIVSADSALMSSGKSEWVRVDFTKFARRFAVTLDHFGIYSAGATTYTENVELRFYDDSALVKTVTISGCRPDGDLASFSDIDPGGLFNTVYIVPANATGTPAGTSDSALLVTDIQTCDTTTGNCRTSSWSGSNKCS